MQLAADGEGGCLHRAGADQLAVAPGLFDHDAEAVARGDVFVEVDVVLEDVVGQRVDRAARQAELAGRMEQRLADGAADDDGARLGRAHDDVLDDLVAVEAIVRRDASRRGRSGRRAAAVDRQVERELGAGLHARQRLLRAGLVEHLVHRGGGQVHVFEQAAEGLAAFDVDDLPAVAGLAAQLGDRQRRQRKGEGGAGLRRREAVGMARSAKPGTMAATSAARVANRLAWAHWRRVQRPLKPAGRRAATWRWSAASRRMSSRARRALSMPDLPMVLPLTKYS